MDAGRNLEKPSRPGLLFLSNSFIAHPFSLDSSCATLARALPSQLEYRRPSKRKSRLSGPSEAFLPSEITRFPSRIARALHRGGRVASTRRRSKFYTGGVLRRFALETV